MTVESIIENYLKECIDRYEENFPDIQREVNESDKNFSSRVDFIFLNAKIKYQPNLSHLTELLKGKTFTLNSGIQKKIFDMYAIYNQGCETIYKKNYGKDFDHLFK